MEYLKQSLEKYLEDLAAKLPAPGGGSASALAGAEGAALLAMVLNFTIGKKGYERFQDEACELLKKIEQIRKELSFLVDEDIRAYTELNNIFKMPKNTEEEKAKRKEAMEKGLKKAESIPDEICRLSYEGAVFCPAILMGGNKNLASDVGVAAALFVSAFKGGRLNVEINLKSILDFEFCKRVREKLDKWQRQLFEIENEIRKKLKGMIA